MADQGNPIANPVAVLREEFDDWAVLFNPDTGDAVGINRTGVLLWKLMDGRRSLEEIVEEVGNRYSNMPETASREITAFMSRLAAYGLIGYAA